MVTATPSLCDLAARRKQLKISYSALADRAGTSVATVQRVLRGDYGSASFDTVARIAQALGLGVDITARVDPFTLKKQAAAAKAEQLAAAVQGTSGLEGQGVDEATLAEIRETIFHDLMAGSPRRIW